MMIRFEYIDTGSPKNNLYRFSAILSSNQWNLAVGADKSTLSPSTNPLLVSNLGSIHYDFR